MTKEPRNVKTTPKPGVQPEKHDAESQEEYEGFMKLAGSEQMRNASASAYLERARTHFGLFGDLQHRSHADLHQGLQAVYSGYLTARARGELTDALLKPDGKRKKGTNKRTHPIAHIIRDVGGENLDRRYVNRLTQCLRHMVAASVPADQAAAFISDHGGPAEVVKMFKKEHGKEEKAENVQGNQVARASGKLIEVYFPEKHLNMINNVFKSGRKTILHCSLVLSEEGKISSGYLTRNNSSPASAQKAKPTEAATTDNGLKKKPEKPKTKRPTKWLDELFAKREMEGKE